MHSLPAEIRPETATGGAKADIDIAAMQAAINLRAVKSNTLSLLGGAGARAAAPLLGILSLSERWDSILMWSHYAISHKGFALGIDGGSEFLRGHDEPVVPEGMSFLVEGFSMTATGPTLWPVLYASNRADHVMNIHRSGVISYADCLTKCADWAYEKEWRAFRSLRSRRPAEKAADSLQDDNWDFPVEQRPGFVPRATGDLDQFGNPIVLFDLPPPALAEVIMGAHMTHGDQVRVARTLATNSDLRHVALAKLRQSPSGFSLEKAAVDIDGLAGAAIGEPPMTSAEERTASDIRDALADLTKSQLEVLRVMVQTEAVHYFGERKVFDRVIDELLASR